MSDETEIVEGEEIGLAPAADQVLRTMGHRWLPGVSGNPLGRPTRKKEERFVNLIADTMSDEDVVAIIRKAVEQAKDGDRWARRFLWEYAVGKPTAMPTVGRQEAPIVTLMKLWVAEAAGDQVLIRGLVAELIGTLPEE